MDSDTMIVILIIVIIVGIGIWCAPPDNIKEKMEKMSSEERKKRELKNVIWTLYQLLLHPITLFIGLIVVLFISTYQ